MDVSSWVVRPGDRVEATGTVRRLTCGYGVIEDYVSEALGGDEFADPSSPLVSPLVVPLGPFASDPGVWSRLEGRRVRVEGRWDGHQVLPTDVGGPAAEELDAVPARAAAALPPPRKPAPSEPPPRDLREAELPLWDDGTLVARRHLLPGSGARYWYAAHDVERVLAALRPLHGDLVEVTPSRWGREVFERLERAVAAADEHGVLIYIGHSLRSDGYDRTFVGVRLLSPDLAEALSSVPDELITVHALLTPSGTRLPPLADDL
jgi:hypothetical protein